MLGHTQHKVQRKPHKPTNKNKSKAINARSLNTAALTKSIAKPSTNPSKSLKATKSKRASLKQAQTQTQLQTQSTHTNTNVQSTLSSQYTPKNQKLQYMKSTHFNTLNKERIVTTSSIEKIKTGDYAKIFCLLNSEIREITDLFKRTQSVDQQNKKDDLIMKKAKGCFYNNNEDIDYVLFEKCLCEEEDKDEKEKVLDISNLEGSETKKMNNCDSVLFSSYNSELYRNLNKDESREVMLPEPSSISSSHNVVKLAKANVVKNKHSRQKSNSIHAENGSDKTECQFTDVVFNNNKSSSSISEKTCDMMEENEHEVDCVPIQEVMKQIRNYKSRPVCIRENKEELV